MTLPKELCKILQSRAEVDRCSSALREAGFTGHAAAAKDFDLAHVLGRVGDGDVIDFGSSDSYLLENLSRGGRVGQLYGIDLRAPNVSLPGVSYMVGSLDAVPLPDASVDYVTCLSVLEHGVDGDRLASEAARLLRWGGLFFVTFDYWEPRVRTTIELYGLPWQPLDREMAEEFVATCSARGLDQVEVMDWSQGDAVITPQYLSPESGVHYTFALMTFRKTR